MEQRSLSGHIVLRKLIIYDLNILTDSDKKPSFSGAKNGFLIKAVLNLR